MQESPDIERLTRFLRRAWLGKRLSAVLDAPHAGLGKHLANVAADDLVWRLNGVTVRQVSRQGKSLITVLQNGWDRQRWFVLQWRLNTTGWIASLGGDQEGDAPLPSFRPFDASKTCLRFTLQFEGGDVWGYYDQDGWGRIYLWSYAELAQRSVGWLSPGGPDWIDDGAVAADTLSWHLPDSHRTVKQILLDQKVTSGLGNVLANEVCWAAKVHPDEIWSHLSATHRTRLGAVARSLVDAALNKTLELSVFGRSAGDWCLRTDCLGSISILRSGKRTAGRSYVCLECQFFQERA